MISPMCLQRPAQALLIVLAWTVPANGVGLPSPPRRAVLSAPPHRGAGDPVPHAASTPAAPKGTPYEPAALKGAPYDMAAREAPPDTGSIGGTIVSTVDRSPLPRARVMLTSSVLAAPRVAISGPDGRYRFGHLPPAAYVLGVMRSGYVPRGYGERRSAPAGFISLSDGQHLEGIDVALAPAGVIAGVILDEDGKPFAGAAV